MLADNYDPPQRRPRLGAPFAAAVMMISSAALITLGCAAFDVGDRTGLIGMAYGFIISGFMVMVTDVACSAVPD